MSLLLGRRGKNGIPLTSWGTLDFLTTAFLDGVGPQSMTVLRVKERIEVLGEGCGKMLKKPSVAASTARRHQA